MLRREKNYKSYSITEYPKFCLGTRALAQGKGKNEVKSVKLWSFFYITVAYSGWTSTQVHIADTRITRHWGSMRRDLDIDNRVYDVSKRVYKMFDFRLIYLWMPGWSGDPGLHLQNGRSLRRRQGPWSKDKETDLIKYSSYRTDIPTPLYLKSRAPPGHFFRRPNFFANYCAVRDGPTLRTMPKDRSSVYWIISWSITRVCCRTSRPKMSPSAATRVIRLSPNDKCSIFRLGTKSVTGRTKFSTSLTWRPSANDWFKSTQSHPLFAFNRWHWLWQILEWVYLDLDP